MDTFFPEYLNKGSKGPAVTLLQLLLKAGHYNALNIQVDGDYGDETAVGVKRLQEALGFDGKEIDGHFGPATRKRYADGIVKINVNALAADVFEGDTDAVFPEESEGSEETEDADNA